MTSATDAAATTAMIEIYFFAMSHIN